MKRSLTISLYRLTGLTCCILGGAATFLIAADPGWKTKRIPEWGEEDARRLLADSPWVKTVEAAILPELTAEQRREGGATGGGTGGGFTALNGVSLLGGGGNVAHTESIESNATTLVTLRWESAFPVRAAELKAHEIGAPDLEGTEYAIAVYQVPGLKPSQKGLASELRKAAALKREGKKNITPSRVEVAAQAAGSAVVVYRFPRNDEVTNSDKCVEFVAQIGRMVVAHKFYTEEMMLHGKLEL